MRKLGIPTVLDRFIQQAVMQVLQRRWDRTFSDFVARRQQSHHCSAETSIEFEPEHFQQMAGLVCYYNASKFHYLYICYDDVHGKHLRVMSALPDQPSADAFTDPIPIGFRGAAGTQGGDSFRYASLRLEISGW